MPPVFAFTPHQVGIVQDRLSDLVKSLRAVPGGGKIEEDYWTYVYQIAKGAPPSKWSNLPMRDYCHDGLGVEIKLLKKANPAKAQGKRLMHPAATRTVSFDPAKSATVCMTTVLEQFGQQISDFRNRVAAVTSGKKTPEIRWGIFLWAPALDEFLYFEEKMIEPNPSDYFAEFEDGNHRGKATRNLWIYEKSTKIKRFSVTMPEKGAKVQPYFDVPNTSQGAYIFSVPDTNEKPIWVPSDLHDEITSRAGAQGTENFLRNLMNAAR